MNFQFMADFKRNTSSGHRDRGSNRSFDRGSGRRDPKDQVKDLADEVTIEAIQEILTEVDLADEVTIE